MAYSAKEFELFNRLNIKPETVIKEGVQIATTVLMLLERIEALEKKKETSIFKKIYHKIKKWYKEQYKNNYGLPLAN